MLNHFDTQPLVDQEPEIAAWFAVPFGRPEYGVQRRPPSSLTLARRVGVGHRLGATRSG